MQHVSFDHLVEEEGVDIFGTGPKLKKKKSQTLLLKNFGIKEKESIMASILFLFSSHHYQTRRIYIRKR